VSDPCASRYRPSMYRWQVMDAYDKATGNLARCLAVAGALCEAYWLGWLGRSCDATVGSFTCDEYWSPGRRTGAPNTMTARWTPRVIPLEPGNEDGPAAIVEVIEVGGALVVDVWHRGRSGFRSSVSIMSGTVACQLGQALQDASAWASAERDRREARRR
jgi:hypothetical protein